jgi:hypothetical protein
VPNVRKGSTASAEIPAINNMTATDKVAIAFAIGFRNATFLREDVENGFPFVRYCKRAP